MDLSDVTTDKIPDLPKEAKLPAWGANRLGQVNILKRFQRDELIKIYGLGTFVTLKPFANAVIEGEPTRSLYLILSGSLSVFKADPKGELLRLATLEEGEYFGELSLFDEAPRSATVRAETACHLFVLEAEAFQNYLQATGIDAQLRFYRSCAEEMAQRFRQLNVDYIHSQHLIWKHALRREGTVEAAPVKTPPPPKAAATVKATPVKAVPVKAVIPSMTLEKTPPPPPAVPEVPAAPGETSTAPADSDDLKKIF